MKKVILLVAAAFALAVPASGVAGPERAATGSTSFADSTGELSGGPDITNVTVANDNAGLLTFTIAIPNRPALASDMAVLIFLDTDQNPSTGRVENDGAEYVLDYEGGTADLGKWNGSAWTWDSPQSSLVTSYLGGLTLKISTADLGGITGFNFYVAAGQGPNDAFVVDFAPDMGHGTWNYHVAIDPPVVKPAPAPKPVAKKPAAKKKPAKKKHK